MRKYIVHIHALYHIREVFGTNGMSTIPPETRSHEYSSWAPAAIVHLWDIFRVCCHLKPLNKISRSSLFLRPVKTHREICR